MLVPLDNYHVGNHTELVHGREQSLLNENPDQTKPEVHRPLEFSIALCPP